MTKPLLGIRFSPLTAEEIASEVCSNDPVGAFRMIATANIDHIANLSMNPEFRAAYADAWLATIDGTPVHVYAQFAGRRDLPKVPGSDLLPVILERLRPGIHRPFFVAAAGTTAESLKRQLLDRGFAEDSVGIAVPEFGFEADGAALLRAIVEHGTTHLFMGVGAPKSEIWMHQNRLALRGCYGFGFGAGLDYTAGTRRRAPALFRSAGLEWAWRALAEPRRLPQRYARAAWGFGLAVLNDLRTSRG